MIAAMSGATCVSIAMPVAVKLPIIQKLKLLVNGPKTPNYLTPSTRATVLHMEIQTFLHIAKECKGEEHNANGTQLQTNRLEPRPLAT